jgi:NADPH-dependent 2,4-dienoyl-CoA reductase/sulfur reductase-like enzyme
MLSRIVIVGASLAGLRAAETLRTEGFDGEVVFIGAEAHLPYDRPPLSKRVLSGQLDEDRIQLRHPEEYDEIALELRLGVRATRLDVSQGAVHLDDGDVVPYDGVILATGATPRRLAHQPELDGLFELRTLDDCRRLRTAITASPERVVVVGAGFIGAEVAATTRKQGVDVTILEALPAPLVRGLGPQMGAVCAALHHDHGVDLRVSTGVDGIQGTDHVEAVHLSTGERLAADVVVVGIGVAPAIGWLEDSGLEIRDGVVCDATLAAAPGVYAAGDIARWPNQLFGEEMRVEHWTNAAEQGAAAARNLLAWGAGGDGTPYSPVPFFWSDQYDSRIQFLGRASGQDEVVVAHGSVEDRKFVALYGHAGRLRGAFGLNAPKDLMPYRKLLERSVSWEEAVGEAGARS